METTVGSKDGGSAIWLRKSLQLLGREGTLRDPCGAAAAGGQAVVRLACGMRAVGALAALGCFGAAVRRICGYVKGRGRGHKSWG